MRSTTKLRAALKRRLGGWKEHLEVCAQLDMIRDNDLSSTPFASARLDLILVAEGGRTTDRQGSTAIESR